MIAWDQGRPALRRPEGAWKSEFSLQVAGFGMRLHSLAGLPWRRLLALAVLSIVTAQAVAAPKVPPSSWERLFELKRGQPVLIEFLDGADKRMRGRYDYCDDEVLGITEDGGSTIVLRRERIKKVYRLHEKLAKLSPLVGAAAGAAFMGALVAGEEDIVFWGKVLFVGIGAGGGALTGWAAGRALRTELIYLRNVKK